MEYIKKVKKNKLIIIKIINKINLFLEEKQVKNPGLNNNTSKNKSKLEHIMLVKNYNKSILEKQDLKPAYVL